MRGVKGVCVGVEDERGGVRKSVAWGSKGAGVKCVGG